MFGWDINKLVEGATALVNDAQHDIASWDRREDATEVSTSADPAEAGANEWNFEALSGLTDAFKIAHVPGAQDSSSLPSLSSYLTGSEEPAPAEAPPQVWQPSDIAAVGNGSAAVQRDSVAAAAHPKSAEDPDEQVVGESVAKWATDPSERSSPSRALGATEAQRARRAPRASPGGLLGARKLARAPSGALAESPNRADAASRSAKPASPSNAASGSLPQPEAVAEDGPASAPESSSEVQQPTERGSTCAEPPGHARPGTGGYPSQPPDATDAPHTPAQAKTSHQHLMVDDVKEASSRQQCESSAVEGLEVVATVGEGSDDPGASLPDVCVDSKSPAQSPGAVQQQQQPGGTVERDPLSPALPSAPTADLHGNSLHGHAAEDSTGRGTLEGAAAPALVTTGLVVPANRCADIGAEESGSRVSMTEESDATVSPRLPVSPTAGDSVPNGSGPNGSSGPAPAADAERTAEPAAAAADDASEVVQLREALQARERQLERKSGEVAHVQSLCDQLQKRNEELAQRSSKVSEADLEVVRAQLEARLDAANRKVYAVSKERDALRRGNEKLGTATDLLKEKDAIISQVMEEGELLSKKQMVLEGTIKKLRAAGKEAAAQKSAMEEALTREQAAAGTAKLQLEQAVAALQAAQEAHSADQQQEKQHYESLLERARTAQAQAEQKSAAAAQEGTSTRLKEADARCEALEESIEEIRVSMDRQRASFEMREERLKREVGELERRGQEAERRHEELAAKLPEATRPLLRQMEAMQASASAASAAWAAAERHLSSRVADAESQAAAAAEKEHIVVARLQATQSRLASGSAALDAARVEAAGLAAELDSERQRCAEASRAAARAEEQLRTSTGSATLLRDQLKQAAGKAAQEVAVQQSAAEERLAAADSRVAELQEQLRGMEASAAAAAPRPPAMPGPGYKWVLLKEGQQSRSAPSSAEPREAASWGRPPPEAVYLAGVGLEGGAGSAPQLERLREALRHRDDQLASLQDQMRQLESTRDSLAEELVSAAQAADLAQAAADAAAAAAADTRDARQRLAACQELLGERDEKLEELGADLEDVRALYKDQFLELVNELELARTPARTPIASPARVAAMETA